jgi:hypothetical protein
MVCTVSVKKGKYRFTNAGGTLLLAGNSDIGNAAISVMTKYFFASLIKA